MAFTEQEYILLTNYAKLGVICNVLRSLVSSDLISKEEISGLIQRATELQFQHYHKIDENSEVRNEAT